MNYRVMAVDDEPGWLETYDDCLTPEGYELRGVATIEEALSVAKDWHPHVVLIDQKLEGAGGRDLGLSLIGRIADQNPTSRTLLVTAFATNAAVVRAFADGALDYLEKTAIFETMLLHKVAIFETMLLHKVAIAAKLAEDAMGGVAQEEREAALRRSWQQAQTETHTQRKGKLLEETIRLLFESIPGFTHARTNVTNPTEEIDVLITNRSEDALLSRQGDFIVVECKNWKRPVGTEVITRLQTKIEQRYGRAKLRLCVAMSGFTGTVETQVLTERRGETLILLLDRERVDAWIEAKDRQEWLVTSIEEAIV